MPAAGPGSVAQPSKGRQRPPDEEDAFIRAINRVWAWASRNTATVVVMSAFLVVAVGAFFWYRAYQENREARAATELQTVQARVASGDTAAVAALRAYLESFDGTRSARRARILLARQQLMRGGPGEAASTVEPVADAYPPETPTGYAARRLLGEARAASGDTAAALETFGVLAREARFGFQRRQSAAERAHLLGGQGRLEDAVEIYRRIASEAEGEEADRYRVRLGELEARLLASEVSGGDGVDGGASTGSEG